MLEIVKVPGKKVGVFYPQTLAYFQTNGQLFKCVVLEVSSNDMCRIRLAESVPGYCKGEMLSAPQSLVIPRVLVKLVSAIILVNSAYKWERSSSDD